MSPIRPIAELRRDVRLAYDAGVAAVAAGPATARALDAMGGQLECEGRILVVAVGKAARPMAVACRGLGEGFVLAPEAGGPVKPLVPDDPGLAGYECFSGGHPVPTAAGFTASRRIADAVSALGERDRLLLLLSGGASSLFEVPVPALGDDGAIAVYHALVRSGLPIEQMNLVRSALSTVKAGRLAVAARPAAVATLAISDVVGDDRAVIGSGPTVASRGDIPAAETLLCGLDLSDELRASAVAALRSPVDGVPGGIYRIVACARDAAQGARGSLRAAGYGFVEAPIDPLLGDAEHVAVALADTIRSRAARVGRWCVVVAGETTVRLPSTAGSGGRNRHLACRVAELLHGLDGFALLAAGTDGIDGSATGAGGVVDGGSAARMRASGIDIAQSLRAFDSGTALAAIGDDIVTGASSTNVGDLVVALGTGRG